MTREIWVLPFKVRAGALLSRVGANPATRISRWRCLQSRPNAFAGRDGRGCGISGSTWQRTFRYSPDLELERLSERRLGARLSSWRAALAAYHACKSAPTSPDSVTASGSVPPLPRRQPRRRCAAAATHPAAQTNVDGDFRLKGPRAPSVGDPRAGGFRRSSKERVPRWCTLRQQGCPGCSPEPRASVRQRREPGLSGDIGHRPDTCADWQLPSRRCSRRASRGSVAPAGQP